MILLFRCFLFNELKILRIAKNKGFTFRFIISRWQINHIIIIQMPFTAPKVKALGVILLSKMGSKFYSKYYTQYSTTDFSKTQFDLKSEAGIKKLQKALNQKLKKVNVNGNMGPEKSTFLFYKAEIFSFGGMTILFKLVNQLLILLLCEQ